MINNITWRTIDHSFPDQRITFYVDSIGAKKALVQIEGSGVCIAYSNEYEIRCNEGLILLYESNSSHNLGDLAITLNYSENDELIFDEASNSKFQAFHKPAVILNFRCDTIAINDIHSTQLRLNNN